MISKITTLCHTKLQEAEIGEIFIALFLFLAAYKALSLFFSFVANRITKWLNNHDRMQISKELTKR